MNNETQIEIAKNLIGELEKRLHYYIVIDEESKSIIIHKTAFKSITIILDNFIETDSVIIFMANFSNVYIN